MGQVVPSAGSRTVGAEKGLGRFVLICVTKVTKSLKVRGEKGRPPHSSLEPGRISRPMCLPPHFFLVILIYSLMNYKSFVTSAFLYQSRLISFFFFLLFLLIMFDFFIVVRYTNCEVSHFNYF